MKNLRHRVAELEENQQKKNITHVAQYGNSLFMYLYICIYIYIYIVGQAKTIKF